MKDVLTSLQGDFKLFLQALWDQLDLPSPTRHNMQLQITCRVVPSDYRYRHFGELARAGLLVLLFFGLYLITRKRK